MKKLWSQLQHYLDLEDGDYEMRERASQVTLILGLACLVIYNLL